ncbi:MAG: O-antigen ligase family protein [Geminicoccaceae bacterium]|nr:O-antigen ligase family protein [Geminicoccaceae bacterium]
MIGIRRPSDRAHGQAFARPSLVGQERQRGLIGVIARLLSHLFSFEVVFGLYLYSNALKLIIPLPPLPADETVLLAALSILIGGTVMVREGLRVDGLVTVGAFLLFVTYAFVSWSWSASTMLAPRYLTYYATFQFWNIAAGALILANSRERMVRFVLVILTLSTFIALAGIYIYLTYGSFRFYQGFEGSGRVYNRWGYAASMGVVIAFAILAYSSSFSLKQLLSLVLLGVLGYFILVASSRGSLLAVIGGCAAILATGMPKISRDQSIRLNRAQIIAVVVIVSIVAVIAVQLTMGTSFATFRRFVKLYEQAQNVNLVFGANRFSYWDAALRYWYSAPLFGHGIGNFSILFYSKEILGSHAHNLVLELLADMGFVGLCLFGVLLWSAFRHLSFVRLSNDPLLLVVFMLAISRLTVGMYSTELAAMDELFVCIGMLTLRPPER